MKPFFKTFLVGRVWSIRLGMWEMEINGVLNGDRKNLLRDFFAKELQFRGRLFCKW